MNLSKYKRIDACVIARKLQEELKLNWKQKESIENYLTYNGYTVIQFSKPEKSSGLWRLTFPFFCLFVLLVILSMGIKWLFTGSYYYKDKHWPLRTFEKWKNRLGL